MSQLNYRIAERKDVQDINNLFAYSFELHKEFDKNLNQSWPKDSGIKYFLDCIENNFVIVCEKDSDIIGCLVGSINSSPFYKNKIAEIKHTVTKKDFQCNGIGSRMLNIFFEHCKNIGIKFVDVTHSTQNIDAHNFYIKNGFLGKDTTLMKEI